MNATTELSELRRMYEFSELFSRTGPYWPVGELLQKSGAVAGVAQVVRGRHFALISAL